MKLKKLLSSCLVAVCMMSTVVGCSSNTSDQASSSSTSKGGSSSSSTTEKTLAPGELPELPNNTLKVTASIPNFGNDPTGTAVQLEWQRMMEEYLGVTLDIEWQITPWADYRENEKVILASGRYPDVFTNSWGDVVNEYGEDGQLLNILDYEDYLTYYPRFVEATNGAEKYAYNEDGTAYSFMDGFVNYDNITGAQSFTGFAYRFDVLKEHNLTPATTLDEFTELCLELQALYPDIYVMTNSDKGYPFYRGFVGIFHTWDTLYWNGSEWAFGPIEDNFKEMLKYLNELYSYGLIDPEFATDDGDRCTEKAVTGRALIYPTLWAGMPRAWNRGAAVEGMEWGLAYLPEGDYGTPWKWGSKPDGLSLQDRFSIVISADVEYPEYLVKMVDYQYSDEMIELQNWGIEGETYTKAEDGSKTFTSMVVDAEDPVQVLANYGVTSSAACRTGIVFTPQDFEAQIVQLPTEPWWDESVGYVESQYWVASSEFGGEGSVSPADLAPVISLTPDESTTRATMVNACETIAREYAIGFITGELDIDNEWDRYVATIKGAVDDFDGVLEMLNEKSR